MAEPTHSPPSSFARPARLALEDGTVFEGRAFGSLADPTGDPVSSTGEVVFNTSMTGYQEALTDPSYLGQILVMTATQIGNYGVCRGDVESARVQVAGFVVRELAQTHSNHRAESSLSDWLASEGVLGIEGLDTRALVRKLREGGVLRGVISCDPALDDDELVEIARSSPPMTGRNLASEVSPRETFDWTEGRGEWSTGPGAAAGGQQGPRIIALDCGAKRNIYRHLVELGCRVEVVPHDVTADEIRARKPDGLIVSNGPGDPAAVERTIACLREIAGEIPTFGICLGHQLLALALGARTYKLKFGHRGANQPVRSLLTGRVEITSQNHGFCVDAESLAQIDCEMTHLHLNDATLAGFRHRSRPIFSVQYHPEASPGPHDSAYLFRCFVEMVRSGRPIDGEAMRHAQGGLAGAVEGTAAAGAG